MSTNDPLVNVVKKFTLRIQDYAGIYPNRPPKSIVIGVKELVLRFEPGTQRLGTFHQAIILDKAAFKKGELAKIAATLDHPLPADFDGFEDLSPSDKNSLLDRLALDYNMLGVFVGWRTLPLAEHGWVKQHIGPLKSADELRAEADAEQARVNALRAEADERERTEAQKPEALKTWETPGLDAKLASFPANPSAAHIAPDIGAVAPNTQTKGSAGTAPNTRTGTHGRNAI